MMKNNHFLLAAIFIALLSSGCASMHDDQGWDHMGNPTTHEDDASSIFEHRH